MQRDEPLEVDPREEPPEHWDRWREWYLGTWGGELPGPGVVRRGRSARTLLARRVDELPRPDPSRLARVAKGRAAAWTDGRTVRVVAAEDPRPGGSFGLVSRAYEVTLPKRGSGPIEVVIPLFAERGHVIAGSVRLFRWDEGLERFDLVPISAVDEDHGVAWGRVGEGGLLVAVGVPADPRVRDTLEILDRLGPYRRALEDPRTAAAFDARICQLILCAPDLGEWAFERLGDDWLEMPRDAWPDGGGWPPPPPPGGGGVCEFCLGLPGRGWVPPEIDLWARPGRGSFRPLPATSCPAWTSLGPANVTGPVLGLAAHPAKPEILYAGAQYGGVWKTTDGGGSWRPTMDRELDLNVWSVGLCRGSPEVVYAATADTPLGSNMDLYRSDDGAASWTLRASVPSIFSRAIAVHPTDPDTVWLAGTAGLHLSLDGGASWLVRNAMVDGVAMANGVSIFDGQITDVALDPANPTTVYIAVAQRGVFKTTDAGLTWHRLGGAVTFTVKRDDGTSASTGLTGAYRTLLAVGEDTRPGRNGGQFVVAKVQGTILTSTDGGATWRVLPGQDHGWDNQNTWDSCLAVCPTDQDMIVAGGEKIDVTLDAGAAVPTWATLPSLHEDQQAVAFIRPTPGDFWFANDGFVGKATGRGAATGTASRGLVAAQCYDVAVSQTPQLVVGGATLHTGTLRTGRASFATWEWMNGPEGGPFEIDPADETIMYCSPLFSNAVRRSTDGGATWKDMYLWQGGFELVAIRPDAPATVYAGGPWGRLHVSTDRGVTWDYVKDANGTLLLIDGTGGGATSVASAFAFAPSDGTHAYLGTHFGRLWRTATAATTAAGWEEIAPPFPPSYTAGRRIGALAVDPVDPDTVWVGYSYPGIRTLWRGTRRADGTYAWSDRSGLFGATSLPAFPIAGIVVDPAARRRLWVGTKVGVFVTEDAGDWWRPFDEGMPNVEIQGLRLRRSSRRLYAATWGRGFFERAV